MTETIRRKLNDSPVARWSALILVALMMFFGYMFVDVLSPFQDLLTVDKGWGAQSYGLFAGSEYALNVFVFFLIFAGIILDKLGIRFTGLLSSGLMILGAAIKLYGVSDVFTSGGFGYDFFNSFWTSFHPSAKVASLGFMIFGCGIEMAGITVSKAIVKWFSGKELALAMGLEMSIARLGVFAVFFLSPLVAGSISPDVVKPVAICAILLCVGFITYSVFCVMDRKLDKEMDCVDEEEEEKFSVKDIGKLISSKPFLIVAFLCVIYYSAVFPFQKFATSMFQNTLGLDMAGAARLVGLIPIGAMILTPFFGAFLDFKGKAATMLILGAVLITISHLIFALADLTVPLAITAIVILGVSFSLVPAALWPSVPKLVENRYLGSAYGLIFWIQNIGLLAFPIVIGTALDKSNPGVIKQMQDGAEGLSLNYTTPMLIFACLGILAFFMGLWLKREDKKHGYGLELPNVKK